MPSPRLYSGSVVSAKPAPIRPEHDWFISEDWTGLWRVLSYETVQIDADAAAGATNLTVKPLRDPLSNGDKLLLAGSAGFMVKLGAGAAVGATALTVAATAGPLKVTDRAQKVVDISGYTLTWVLETDPAASVPTVLLTKTPTLATSDPADPDGSPLKVAQVAVLAADTVALSPGTNAYRLSRTDSGNARTLAHGDATLKRR